MNTSPEANEPLKTGLRRNVYIIGPQSTGKTTLVKALVDSLGVEVPVIQEVARKVMQERGYSRIDVDSSDHERKFGLQHDIFNAQVEKEMTFIRAGTAFVSDRSVIDPLIYLFHYSGREAMNRITSTDEWQKVRDRYGNTKQSLVILLSPVPEFLIDDNVRYMSKSLDDWHFLAANFRVFLEEEEIPYIEIGKDVLDIKDRVARVMVDLNSERSN
jgi:nicotinamide riboside kinase